MRWIFFFLAFSLSAHAVETFFEKDDRLPLVNISVALNGGSSLDPEGSPGLTHLLGEMLLRGTSKKTKEQINLYWDQLGSSLDVETRKEMLVFRGAVLSSQLENFLTMLTEILTDPSFPDQELYRLKEETISQIHQLKSEDRKVAFNQFQKTLFGNHPYGAPDLGTIRSIQEIDREDLIQHYQLLVQSKNIVIVGTGKTEEGILDLWSKALSRLRPDQEEIPTIDAPKAQKGKKLTLINKPDRTQTQIIIGHLGPVATDEDYFPLYVGNYVWGGPIFGSRLMQEIREKRGWSYFAGSRIYLGTFPRTWYFTYAPANKDAPKALEYGLQMLSELKENGITQKEFEFAKKSLIAKDGFRYNTAEKRVENILLEKVLNLPEGFFENYESEINSVSLKEVNEALNRFLKPEDLNITVLTTDGIIRKKLMRASGASKENTHVTSYLED